MLTLALPAALQSAGDTTYAHQCVEYRMLRHFIEADLRRAVTAHYPDDSMLDVDPPNNRRTLPQ